MGLTYALFGSDLRGRYEEYRKVRMGKFYVIHIKWHFFLFCVQNHPEKRYVLVVDIDTFFLSNPFNYLKSDEIHVMHDIWPLSVTRDSNHRWLRAWVGLDDARKKSCGIRTAPKSLVSKHSRDVPFNSGFLMGPIEPFVSICEAMGKVVCVGPFWLGVEQGLFDYYVLTGEFSDRGVIFHGHTARTGAFISCPDLMDRRILKKRFTRGEIATLHHYPAIAQLLNLSVR